ncbi:MAG: HDIG domain-containing protein [Eubacteriaceae bacterium]|jgi:putative nucleotidyltransferase with HDIG domain|nr:HDIG domain-containing protein [Eubacteriaceae bacterium]
MGTKAQAALRKPRGAMLVRLAISAFFAAAAIAMSLLDFSPSKFDMAEGEVAQDNIIATRRIVDVRMTRFLQEQAANNRAPVYDYMNSAGDKAKSSAEKLFGNLNSIYADYVSQSLVDTVNDVFGTELTLADVAYFLQLSIAEREQLQSDVLEALSEGYRSEIRASEIDIKKALIIDSLSAKGMDPAAFAIASNVIRTFVQPNMILNEQLTEGARQMARDSVYEVVYEAGQTIVNRGEVVTANQIALLSDNGMLKRKGLFGDPLSDFASFAILSCLTAALVYYIARFSPESYESLGSFALMMSQFLIAMALAKATFYFSVYLVPASFLAMSVSVLFSGAAASLANVFLILFLSIILPMDVDSAFYLLCGGLAAAASLKKVSGRNSLLWAGLITAGTNVLIICLFAAVRKDFALQTVDNIGYGLGSAAFAAILTIALTMVCELLFNLATPFRLLEMAAPGDPAIQSLISSAQGTYHHSLIVSNLAEAACEEIGANSLLARVGSYYHDLGKLSNTAYFKENQGYLPNPHDDIAPETSAQIIKGHVSSGLELAAKYHLPKAVTEFIRTHHGTSEISFFKAMAEKGHYEGPETFRYEFSLPKTKETSVVMLADSVEAAVRSLDLHTEESIESMIDKIIAKKIREGQLAESQLSFAELKTVHACFLSVLLGVYHSRLQYPAQPEELEETEAPQKGGRAGA